MPDENPTTTETTDAPKETSETPAAGTEETPEGDAPKADEKPEEKPEEEEATNVANLPDFAQRIIRDLRAENANYRTRATSAETKLSEAKPEELAATVAQVQEENARLARELLVNRVASKFDLPSELADLLKGDDEAALETHAKTLAKYAGSDEPENLRGGLNPTEGESFDPVKAARAARRRRY